MIFGKAQGGSVNLGGSMDEKKLTEIRVQMEMLVTERAGMIAQNQIHIVEKKPLSYAEQEFERIRIELGELLNVLRRS